MTLSATDTLVKPKAIKSNKLIRIKQLRNVLSGSASKSFHGDDALFADNRLQIVVDGVGGTKTSSAPFAVALVDEIRSSVTNGIMSSRRISSKHFSQWVHQGILKAKRNFTNTTSVMAAALSVVLIDTQKSRLLCLTIGDTKTVVIRKGSIVFESTSLIHEFNVPVTVTTTIVNGTEQYARRSKFTLLPEDVILSFSDGVADNLFVNDIKKLVSKYISYCPDRIASEIVRLSYNRAEVPDVRGVPFAIGAALEYCKRATKETNLSSEVMQNIKKLSKQIKGCEILTNEATISLASKHYDLESLLGFTKMEKGKMDDISATVTIVH